MFTIKEIIDSTSGKLIQGTLDQKVLGVSTDSRSVKKTDCFIAVIGERLDGHHFIKQVIEKGIKVVVVSQRISVPKGVAVIDVKDTTKALGQLANFHRRRFSIPVIAITGSAGKTTTKEMIADVLSTKYKVLKNYKTENNHFGVPYTLFKLNSSHQVAVIEVGTNQFGDIPWLGRIVEPTISVFTNIGESHLEKLKSKQGVFKEKFSLVSFMPKKSVVIFNEDDLWLRKIRAKNLKCKKLGYGIKANTDYQATGIQLENNLKIKFSVGKNKYELKTVGQQNIDNALAAIVCGKLCHVSVDQIKRALSRFTFPSGRQEIRRMKQVIVINDSYNANPVSYRAAVSLMDSLNVSGQRIMICADMLELGAQSKKLHQQVGGVVGRSKVDCVFSIGNLAKHLTIAARKVNQNILIKNLESIDQLNIELLKILSPGDAVLVKGSRRMQMERVVDFLEKNFKT